MQRRPAEQQQCDVMRPAQLQASQTGHGPGCKRGGMQWTSWWDVGCCAQGVSRSQLLKDGKSPVGEQTGGKRVCKLPRLSSHTILQPRLAKPVLLWHMPGRLTVLVLAHVSQFVQARPRGYMA